MQIALLGRKLGHSLSPEIHRYLGSYTYELHPMELEELEPFFDKKDFLGLNVTIPYKKDVVKYIDEMSDTAKRIGCVNTIYKREDGTLYGDNTDYFGFSYMAKSAGISFENKKVLVLGSGGASLTARLVVADQGAKEVIVISRSGENNYDNISKHYDADIIVNCTPVGMYPNNGVSPVDIEPFCNLSGVLDMIYNPYLTKLLIDAKNKGIKYANGLTMLVAQGAKSAEYFRQNETCNNSIEYIVDQVAFELKNITFVGMPGCGKSTQSQMLAKKLARDVIDTDAMIVERACKSIPDIFSEQGEDAFRDIETQCVLDASKQKGKVIATGGGAILRKENREAIISNSIVIFLHKQLSTLDRSGRPLSQNADLNKMYEYRLPFYKEVAMIDIDVQSTPTKTHKLILEKLGIK